MQRVGLGISAIFALVLGLLFLAHSKRENSGAKEPGQTPQRPRSQEPDHTDESPLRNSNPAGSPSSRAQQLADLKKRWLRVGEPLFPGSYTTEDLEYRSQLSEESARLLLCSPEAVELLQFLEKEQIYNLVETKIQNLFGGDLAQEARRTLITLPDSFTSDRVNYRDQWSGPAGRGCPPEEFAEFSLALKRPTCVQEAVFGHNIALAQTDPVGAMVLTLAQIEKGAESLTKNSSVRNLIRKLPPGTDFERIDAMLPLREEKDPRSPFFGLRPGFIISWSKSDPAGAANFIIEHPGRFPVSDITTPVMEVMSKDPAAGIAWIETFPSGPYFNSAAGIGVDHFIRTGMPGEAERLASKISDPKTRKALMEAALRPPEKLTESQ